MLPGSRIMGDQTRSFDRVLYRQFEATQGTASSSQNKLPIMLVTGTDDFRWQLQAFPPTTHRVPEPATPMLRVTLGVLVAVRRPLNSRKYLLS